MHVILANPFRSFDSTVPKVREKLAEYGIDGQPANFSVHRQTMHPEVSKHGAGMTPGWNVSNDESRLSERRACYVIFDRDGRIVFRGRLTFEEVEEKIRDLL